MNDLWKTVMETVTWLDIFVIVLLLFFIIRGAWIGLIRQVAAFLALVGSYVVTALYLPQFLPMVSQFVQDSRLVFLVGFVLLFLFSALCFTLIGKILRHLVEVVFLAGWFDRLLGALLGVIKAFLLASLVYMGLAALSPKNPVLDESKSTPFLKQGAEILRTIVRDEKLKSYFGRLPLPGSGPGATQGKPAGAPGQAQPGVQGSGQPMQDGTGTPPNQQQQGMPPNAPQAPDAQPVGQPGAQGWDPNQPNVPPNPPNQQGLPQNAPPAPGGQPGAQQDAWGANPPNSPPQGPPPSQPQGGPPPQAPPAASGSGRH